MGIRQTQIIGLTDWAKDLLKKGRMNYHDSITRTYENGEVAQLEINGSELPSTKIGEFEGMFGESYPLNQYTIKGRIYQEYVQAEPWSSGPCIFLALKTLDGNVVPESLWAQSDIDNC